MSIRSFAFTALVAISSVFMLPTDSIAATTTQHQDIRQLTQQLERFAYMHGATVEDIKFSKQVQVGGQGVAATAAASCTATATVSIPGGTGVTLSATASTCTQAVSMLQNAIAEFYSTIEP